MNAQGDSRSDAGEQGCDELPQHRWQRDDARKLVALRAQIEAGITDLERGDFDEIDEAELEDYLERLTASVA